MKSHYYSAHAGALRVELGQAISREQMRALHKKQPARHLLVAARQFAILGLTTWALVRFDAPWIWIPLAFVQGFTIFNFTVLLHEVLHHLVFEKRHARIVLEKGRYYLVDEDTPGGTYLNGERISGPTPLRAGDEIEVGRARLRFGESQKRNRD